MSTKHKTRKKKSTKKFDDLASFAFSVPMREQIVEDMYEENIARDRKRSQSYII